MTSELVQFLGNLFIGGIVVALLLHRKDRRIAYLRAVAGDRDLWNRKCGTCGRKMRDSHSLVVSEPRGGGVHETVFHVGNKRACDMAGRAAGDPS